MGNDGARPLPYMTNCTFVSNSGLPGLQKKSGRNVTVGNSKIFSEPVFNYTRDFPFVWEEMVIPITYKANRMRAEAILVKAASCLPPIPPRWQRRRKPIWERQYGVEALDMELKVFFRITDNWLELSLRFIVTTHKIRSMKDAMNRFIDDEFAEAGLAIAAATYDIVGLPPIVVNERQRDGRAADLEA